MNDTTMSQLRLKVRKTPGVSEKKKVDGKWVPKKNEDMIADLSAQPKKTGITSAAERMCKANKAYKAYKEAYKAYYKAYYKAHKEDTQAKSPPRNRTKQKFYKGFILA